MKRNAGKQPISTPYKRPRTETASLEPIQSKSETLHSIVPEPRRHTNKTSDASTDKDTYTGVKDSKTKSNRKSPTKRSGPTPSWELETATFNPKCKHCNRRWLLETQEIVDLTCDSSLSDTEEY